MLVIHPDSNCDICLEQFATDSPSRSPHAPRCGHVFCLRCLKALARRVCPMCRNPFQPGEVTRIHLDQRSFTASSRSPGSAHSSSSPPPPANPGSSLARELHDRINAFVSTGASTSVAHTLSDDCKSFFQDNAPAAYLDFYVTYQLLNHFLLGYYRAFFQEPSVADKSLHKFQSEVQAYHQSWENRYRRLSEKIDDLTEKLQLEVIAKENEMQERETAEAVVQSLKDELQAQESWWHWKYEELQGKHSELQVEVSDLRGAQIQDMVSQCPTPDFEILEEKSDSLFKRTKDHVPPPLALVSPFDRDWDSEDFDLESEDGSPEPPTYDYAMLLEGSLSIISTPHVNKRALRNESEMKEMLFDLLRDPVPTARRTFNPITHMSPKSSLRVPSSSTYMSSPNPTTLVIPDAPSPSNHPKPQPQSLAPPLSAPVPAPLWTRKRSATRPGPHHPYSRDSATGKGRSTTPSIIARSISASEAE